MEQAKTGTAGSVDPEKYARIETTDELRVLLEQLQREQVLLASEKAATPPITSCTADNEVKQTEAKLDSAD